MLTRVARRRAADLLPRIHTRATAAVQWQCLRCRYSTTIDTSSSPSPVLSRLRDDLKTAMRAKDTARLSVLRMVLAEITNASKTNTPIKDDISLLTLLKKRIAASKTSIQEFYNADRKDLVQKEEEQMNILSSYADGIKTMSEGEITEVVKKVIEAIKADGRKLALGDVMKRAMGPEGMFEGRMVEKSEVVRVIKAQMEAATS